MQLACLLLCVLLFDRMTEQASLVWSKDVILCSYCSHIETLANLSSQLMVLSYVFAWTLDVSNQPLSTTLW